MEMNQFLTSEEKERIRLRIEKSLEDIKKKYENVTLAEKTDDERKRDLEEYSRIQGL